MKKKIILSAILSICLCVSMIAGATFAIFTSESKVNIAVTSGKVDIVATIDETSAQTKQLYDEDYTTGKDHMYQGEVEFTEDGLSLKKFLPGDGIKFDIIVTNNSNVKVKYRTLWAADEDEGLLDGLTITVDGEAYDGATLYSAWGELEPESADQKISVEVVLPEKAGNEYQDKTCVISFKVEALQGNATADNSVARIGETKYDSLQEAVAALNEGDTLTITRPGTYAPFKINKQNVTVEGIIGKTKSESTVIRNTATENIKAYADNLTFRNLYIDSTKPQTIMWMNSGAVDAYTSTDAGIVAKNLTLEGCVVDGNGAAGSFAFLYCGEEITLKNNTFNNFETVYSAMCDNGRVTKATVVGNTFNNVVFPVSGYWGASMVGDDYNVVITDNNFCDGAIIHLWDYYQYQIRNNVAPSEGVAVKAQIKGNKGDYSVVLTHNNWFSVNENDIEAAASVSYRRLVKFDVDSANYKVYNKDGSEIVTVMYDSTTLGNQGGYLALYAITEGEYLVKNTVTGATFAITVTAPEIGSTQVVSLLEDTDITFSSETKIAEGATIVGAGIDKTTVTADKVSLKDNVTLKDMTIECVAPAGNDGAIKMTGTNTTMENVQVNGQGFNGDTKAISVTGSDVIIRNSRISGAFRGIIFWDNIGGDNVIENCVIDNVIYTININAGSVKPGTTLTVKGSTLNGWTSYSACMTKVTFVDSKLGMSNGYAYMKAYADTEIKNCVFNDDYRFAAGTTGKMFTFTDCKLGDGTVITAENFAEKLGDVDVNLKGCTVIVNGVTVNWN